VTRLRDVVKKTQEEEVLDKSDQSIIVPSQYGCEILLEKATLQQLKDPSFPLDAHIVTYIVKDETYTDLCRGSKVKIFDLYFDKFGHGAVQKISWGYGKVSPKVWGYKAPEKKKRK
jgi:hypothetical protein